jgi:hypothetical protein
MLPMPPGDYQFRQRVLALAAGAVVVDSTGPLHGREGERALKHMDIELITPSTVVGLRRGRELEPLSGRSAAGLGSRRTSFLSLPTWRSA